jgi:hypothetical protein
MFDTLTYQIHYRIFDFAFCVCIGYDPSKELFDMSIELGKTQGEII